MHHLMLLGPGMFRWQVVPSTDTFSVSDLDGDHVFTVTSLSPLQLSLPVVDAETTCSVPNDLASLFVSIKDDPR